MSEGAPVHSDAAQAIPRGGMLFLVLWTLSLVGVCVASGYFGVRSMASHKALARQERASWRSAGIASGATEAAPAGASRPVDVHVGLFLERVSEIELREGAWTADFLVSFQWQGDGVSPGEHLEVANGRILESEKVVALTQGTEHFEKYRVRARLVKPFDTSRAPVSEAGLILFLQDAVDGGDRLRYVADSASATAGLVVLPLGFAIASIEPDVLVAPARASATVPPAFGRPEPTRSLYALAIVTTKPGVSRYVRIFQALFASVAICLIVFFIKPTHVDPRFGLPVGAFFAAVGNNISVAAAMPDSGRVTLVQMINMIGLATIFLTLVQSAISLHLYDSLGRERFSRIFDQLSFVLIGAGYLVLNFLLPMSAR